MSDDDVHPNEMNEPHDFDDAATDDLLSGTGRGIDPSLADLLGDMRVAYTSTPPVIGAELSALMGATQPAPTQPISSRRFEKMRSSMLAKVGVGVASFVAATGSLAVAHALPAPVQDAVSHLGIGAPAHHNGASSLAEDTTTTVDPTVTTTPSDPTAPGDTTTTTGEPTDNHGGDVSGVAHDPNSNSCDHGSTVSNVASDGQSNNDSQNASNSDTQDTSNSDSQDASSSDNQSGSCETTTTIAGDTTTTTTMDNNQNGDAQDGTPPTTVDPGTTPTTEVDDGDNQPNPSNSAGDSSSGGSGDSSGGSGSGGGN